MTRKPAVTFLLCVILFGCSSNDGSKARLESHIQSPLPKSISNLRTIRNKDPDLEFACAFQIDPNDFESFRSIKEFKAIRNLESALLLGPNYTLQKLFERYPELRNDFDHADYYLGSTNDGDAPYTYYLVADPSRKNLVFIKLGF